MSRTQRSLTEDENDQLANLNAAVAAAIQARSLWLDAKMHETSQLQVGDDIYDLDNGRRLGRVSELYRFWRDRDDGVRDTSVGCDYRYETQPRCFDNTSRQVGLSFGTREEAASRAEMQVSLLREETNR